MSFLRDAYEKKTWKPRFSLKSIPLTAEPVGQYGNHDN